MKSLAARLTVVVMASTSEQSPLSWQYQIVGQPTNWPPAPCLPYCRQAFLVLMPPDFYAFFPRRQTISARVVQWKSPRYGQHSGLRPEGDDVSSFPCRNMLKRLRIANLFFKLSHYRKPSQIEQASHGAALSARASVFSTQGEPDRACSRSAWKIRQRQWPVKSRGATRFFQAIASHDF
jgi:hypothetical protein